MLSDTNERDRGFENRLFEHYDEMKWLHGELYDDERAFVEYIALLKEFYMRLKLSETPLHMTEAILPDSNSGAESREETGAGSLIDRYTAHDRIGVFKGLKNLDYTTGTSDPDHILGVSRMDVYAPRMYPNNRWGFPYRGAVALRDLTADILKLCVDGERSIRLCADPCIPGSGDYPGAHTNLRILRMAVHIVCPDAVLLGDTTLQHSSSELGFGPEDKPEFDVLYNDAMMAAIWHTVATCDARLIKHLLDGELRAPKRGIFLNYLSDRGTIDWSLDYDYLGQFGINEEAHRKFLNDYYTGVWPGSTARGDLLTGDSGAHYSCGAVASLSGIKCAELDNDPAGLERALTLYTMLHALLFTLRGMPVINPMDATGVWRYDDPYPMPGRAEKVNHALSLLAKLRAEHTVFDNAADVWLLETWNDRMLGLGRYYQGEKLLAIFNFGDHAETAWIDEAEPYTDLITDAFREARMVEIPSRSFVWLVTKF